MRAVLVSLAVMLLLGRTPSAVATMAAGPAETDFQRQWGGYLTSNSFRVDPNRAGVVLLPAGVLAGDLLRIRPLRLNSDEYLFLQKCLDAECSKAQVVRAWNAYGYMGPYPVLTNTVRVEAGGSYLLWLQRVPTLGNGTFNEYDRDAPPLTFKPAGSPELFKVANLQAAQEYGPSRVTKTRTDGAQFVVTFDRGSVVRMQALRPAGSPSPTAP